MPGYVLSQGYIRPVKFIVGFLTRTTLFTFLVNSDGNADTFQPTGRPTTEWIGTRIYMRDLSQSVHKRELRGHRLGA